MSLVDELRQLVDDSSSFEESDDQLIEYIYSFLIKECKRLASTGHESSYLIVNSLPWKREHIFAAADLLNKEPGLTVSFYNRFHDKIMSCIEIAWRKYV